MSFVPKLKQFVITKKWYILGAILFISLSSGGIYGWKHYTYLQSPQYFIEQLNLATQSNDFVKLASLVDFLTVSDEIAQKIVRAPIPSTKGNPRETDYIVLSEKIQRDFILNMQNKDEEIPPNPNMNPLAPLEALPKDFAAQISGKFQLQIALENEGIVNVKVHYPRLKKDYVLQFIIEKKPDWIITRFKNIDEIITEYIAEENKIDIQRDLKFQKDNAKAQKEMTSQFRVDSCTAFVHTTSDGHSTFFIRINGYNNGPHIIRNMTFDTNILGRTSEEEFEFKRNLNMATRLLPGVDLQDSYSFELDPKEELDAKILAADGFACMGKPKQMTLDNGRLLFTRLHRLEQ